MNILIYSDEHRTVESAAECLAVDTELISLKEEHKCDLVISLGDNFDSIKPSSSELTQFATFIKKLNCKFIIIAANSHESTTQEESILNHYGILSDNVQIVKEYKDGDHMYCGHFSIKESSKNYDAKLSRLDFKKYLYVFLGHIHSYQLIKPNILHLGSCRYVNFDEASDKHKIVALIMNYNTEAEKVHFLRLKSPIPMIELKLYKKTLKEAPGASIPAAEISAENKVNQTESKQTASTNPLNPGNFGAISDLTAYLDKLGPKTKVKVKILDFESFRDFLPSANKYLNKFVVFKYETEFKSVSVNIQKSVLNETTSFKEAFIKWLKQQTIDVKVKEILLKEIE
jgi:DNA repair exonuclease SbcCD nuclease subunit